MKRTTDWIVGGLALALACLLVSFVAVPAGAFTIDSDTVVVPVVVHLSGYNGTQWRSDVWLFNVYSRDATVTLKYYPVGGSEMTATVEVAGFRGVHLRDVVLETFGLDNSKGLLIVSSEDSNFEVRARVYNTGNACGEFGQAVPGIPMDRLDSSGGLTGITAAGGTRLSVGVANPTDQTIHVQIWVTELTAGQPRIVEDLSVAPHQLLQIDKAAEKWGYSGQDNLEVDVIAQSPSDNTTPRPKLYAYASMVRQDTGDGTFIFGTTPNGGPS